MTNPGKSLRAHDAGGGFTLVELLVSVAIISFLCLILVQITSATASTWRYTTNKVEQFQAARAGFESMTRKINQATLNTYWDYEDPKVLTTASTLPTRYIRQSELRFISGTMVGSPTANNNLISGPTRKFTGQGIFFHAPMGLIDRSVTTTSATVVNPRGLEKLLNVCGYFVEYGNDKEYRPSIITDQISPPRYRFRLMELMAPAEVMQTYSRTATVATSPGTTGSNYRGRDWYSTFINTAPPAATSTATTRPTVRVLAENIVTLIFVPKLSKQDEERRGSNAAPLSPAYLYDSKPLTPVDDAEINPVNQLPPVVQVTMVAIDELSAARFADTQPDKQVMPVWPANPSPLFVDPRKLFDDPATPAARDGELAKLEADLIARKINYRIFTADVKIGAAKWSREQKK